MRCRLPVIALFASLCVAGCDDRLDPLRPRDLADAGVFEAGAVELSVAPLYPVHGANWLDYVARDGTKGPTEQGDAACDPSGWTYYHECLHGGELRKVVAPGHTRCEGLSMRDELGVFRWVCDDSSAEVFFYSTGFEVGKGLADIVGADGFASNRVFLQSDGRLLAESPPSTRWWSNRVAPLTLNSGTSDAALELDSEGSIYTVASSGSSRGLVIKADRVGLVVLHDATLSGASSLALDCDPASVDAQPCLIYGESGSYAWVEGSISLLSGATAIVQGRFGADDTRRWRYHNLELLASGAGSTALYIESGEGTMLTQSELWGQFQAAQVRAAKNVAFHRTKLSSAGPRTLSIGVNAWHALINDCQIANGSEQALDIAAWYVTVANSRIYNSAGQGIRAAFARSTYLINTLIANNGEEGAMLDSLGAYVLGATSANNGGPGLLIEDNGSSTAFNIEGLVSINNAKGLEVQMGDGRLGNLYLGHNDIGVEINNAATGLVFSEALVLGENGEDCLVTSTGLETGLGSSGGTCELRGSSDATITGATSSAGFFFGAASADAKNEHAAATSPSTDISDWFDFENAGRLWGRDGSYGTSALRGACDGSATCRIWDWTLRAGATPLHGAHGDFVAGAPCPPSVQGDQVFRYADHAGQDTYALRHAVELFGDLRGNENGFCDSGEACLFMPHWGACLQRGSLAEPCIFEDGVGAHAVRGISLFGDRDL